MYRGVSPSAIQAAVGVSMTGIKSALTIKGVLCGVQSNGVPADSNAEAMGSVQTHAETVRQKLGNVANVA
ncbi:MAG: hypothetical protein CMH52_06215 [Myxococcales bacterium]|nr:hypothetical protein [Myxococcales bacterium]